MPKRSWRKDAIEQIRDMKPDPAKILKFCPDDVEPRNADRSHWAEQALLAFAEQTGSDAEDLVSDLIADLGHWCDRHGLDLETEIERGLEHYHFETSGDEQPMGTRCTYCGNA